MNSDLLSFFIVIFFPCVSCVALYWIYSHYRNKAIEKLDSFTEKILSYTNEQQRKDIIEEIISIKKKI
jgi:low temperature requirement protein LtrA